MKQECPYCGRGWALSDKRKKDLFTYNVITMRCVCGNAYELQRVNKSIYARYRDRDGSVRERLGGEEEV